mgnify:CR=1 FL=1
MNLQTNANYHHRNLKDTLITITQDLIDQGGLEAVSLRKLAEKAGVSRTAPYHHFKDKNDLLAAVAEKGFETLTQKLKAAAIDTSLSLTEQLEKSILNYIHFAVQNPTQYDLMFGSALWRKSPSPRLQRTAKDSFREYAALIQAFSDGGLLQENENPLRLAQLMWATLHGLVKLTHDGIFVRQDDLEDISRYAIQKIQHMLGS